MTKTKAADPVEALEEATAAAREATRELHEVLKDGRAQLKEMEEHAAVAREFVAGAQDHAKALAEFYAKGLKDVRAKVQNDLVDHYDDLVVQAVEDWADTLNEANGRFIEVMAKREREASDALVRFIQMCDKHGRRIAEAQAGDRLTLRPR